MTKQERMTAFEMRLEGRSWREIGQALGYSHTAVYNDLQSCIVTRPRQLICIYPALRQVIEQEYDGSINAFADACGVPYNTMYLTLSGRIRPNKRKSVICSVTGLPPEEAFRLKED